MKVGTSSLSVFYSFFDSLHAICVTYEMWESQESGSMTDFAKLSHQIQKAANINAAMYRGITVAV